MSTTTPPSTEAPSPAFDIPPTAFYLLIVALACIVFCICCVAILWRRRLLKGRGGRMSASGRGGGGSGGSIPGGPQDERTTTRHRYQRPPPRDLEFVPQLTSSPSIYVSGPVRPSVTPVRPPGPPPDGARDTMSVRRPTTARPGTPEPAADTYTSLPIEAAAGMAALRYSSVDPRYVNMNSIRLE